MNRSAFLLVLVLPAVGALAGDDAPAEFDWGFVASRLVDANGDTRLRAIGPVFERARSPDGKRLNALRPFYASARDPESGTLFRDFLWPVATARWIGNERSWRCLLVYSWHYDVEDPLSRRKFWILPILFEGRGEEGNRYFAIFPVGGRVRDFVSMDRIDFVLFPLYVRSQRGRSVSHTYLWPFISTTGGGAADRFRVFPVYGRTRYKADYEKKFVLWPFWTSARYHDRGATGRAFILFPIVGRASLERHQTWWIIPPFFRITRGERQNLVHGPWPFFQRAEGETQRFYLWPIWGTRRNAASEKSFFLWPLGRGDTVDRGTHLTYTRRFWPFFYWGRAVAREGGRGVPDVEDRSYFKFWPVYSVLRQGNLRRERVLDLWPARRHPAPVERSWAPWWVLWQRTRTENNSDTEFLWGLYRQRRRGDAFREISLFPVVAWRRSEGESDERSWSLLKGLVGYRREDTHASLQLLYFVRIGSRGPEP